MDSMNNSTSSTSMGASMTPWLHFGSMDYLLFASWRPASAGAIAGASIGLFLFSVLERCLAAYRRVQESRWSAIPVSTSNRVHFSSGKEYEIETPAEAPSPSRRRRFPPFTPSRDIPRGVIHAVQSTFSFALMLTVMSFNGAYVLSVILGLGIGEALFGRLGRGNSCDWQ